MHARRLFAGALVAALSVHCAAPVDVEGGRSKTSKKTDTPADRAADEPASGAVAPPAGGATAPEAKTDLVFTTFGNKTAPAIIYIHGGPGAGAKDFEDKAAPSLADRGLFVVSYDQRGAPRSPKGTPGDYSYQGAARDLNDLIRSLGLVGPVLLGHSFGGSIAMNFLELHPGVAKAVILLASPMNFPKTYFTILENSAVRYRRVLMFGSADEMDALKAKMFPRGPIPPFDYGADDIGTAAESMFKTGLVFPHVPSAGMVADLPKQLLSLSAPNHDVGTGYQANDKSGWRDFTPLVAKHANEVFGIYGDEDEIFSDAQRAAISSAMAPGHFRMIEGASHYVFPEEPEAFTDSVVTHMAAATKR